MLLSPARFNQMIRQMGQAVSWRSASPCPNVNPDSGQPHYDCPLCRALGTLWAPPCPEPTWAMLAGLKVQREYAAFGRWESGDVLVSIGSDCPMYAAGEKDRITLLDSTEPFQLVLTRDGTDRVIDGTIAELDRCFWLPPGGSVAVEGTLPTWDATGLLSWPAGAVQPDMGQQYSLVGRRHPEFFVFGELPQDRAHFNGLELPRRVQLKRFGLFAQVGGAPT